MRKSKQQSLQLTYTHQCHFTGPTHHDILCLRSTATNVQLSVVTVGPCSQLPWSLWKCWLCGSLNSLGQFQQASRTFNSTWVLSITKKRLTFSVPLPRTAAYAHQLGLEDNLRACMRLFLLWFLPSALSQTFYPYRALTCEVLTTAQSTFNPLAMLSEGNFKELEPQPFPPWFISGLRDHLSQHPMIHPADSKPQSRWRAIPHPYTGHPHPGMSHFSTKTNHSGWSLRNDV